MNNFEPSDVQDIVSKLSSDKVKSREDGIKLLNSCLEGESSVSFCKFLSENTALLKPGQIPHDGTWPFLIRLLIQCISLEISSSKKRLPKLIFAKTLRLVVQRIEDAKFSGKALFMLSVVRSFFSHIWDVLRDVPSFQSEYGIILRHLFGVSDYRVHIKKRVYCGLVLLYMEKVEASLSVNDHNNPKEEVFRCILTLHSLVKNPPGDFSDILRDGIVKGIARIFNVVRDEGKISRKLIEFINTFLLKDGPNLGCRSSEIHNAVQQFVFRYWLTTHDRGLKDALISYAKLQLKLIDDTADGSSLVEQLLDVIVKDLDQINSASSGTWSDFMKDDKFGNLTSSQCRLVELAAFVFYLGCVDMHKMPPTNKRARREHVSSHLREELMKGKWIWSAIFCCLIHNYHARISKDLFIYWFHGICTSFQSILDNANMEHAYDGLLWTLRSLQELIYVLSLPILAVEDTVNHSWYSISILLIHGLPIFSNVSAIVDVALVLLGNIICSDMLNAFVVPRDMWDLQIFKRVSSLSVLYFICCYFSRSGNQGDIRENLLVRRNLLRAVLDHIDAKEFVLNEISVVLIPGTVFALCASCAVSPSCKTFFSLYYSSYFVDTMGEQAQIEKLEDEHFDCSVEVIAKIHQESSNQAIEPQILQKISLPRQICSTLLFEVETRLLATVSDKETEKLSDVLLICALVSNFIHGAFLARLNQGQQSLIAKLGHCVTQFVDRGVVMIEQIKNDIQYRGRSSMSSMFDDKICVISCFRSFVSCPIFVQRDHGFICVPIYTVIIQSIEKFLMALVNLYEKFSGSVRQIECEEILLDFSYCGSDLQNPYLPSNCKSRIVDMELDMDGDSEDVDILSAKSHIFSSTSETWKLNMLSLISCCFVIVPVITWEFLFGLVDKENEYKASENIICTLCEHPFWSLPTNFLDLIHFVDNMIDIISSRKLQPFNILSSINGLLRSILSMESSKNENNEFLPLGCRASEQGLATLGNLVSKVAEFDLTWFGRIRLIDSISSFILLRPQIGQTMIERLFLLLRDPDYRVRIFLARRISVLFLTWEGHDELFNDICCNFGISLVMMIKGKIVTSRDVLADGPQPRSKMETIIISLMHLAVCSEKIEFEAVFIICAVSAANPCLRELIIVVLNNLSKHLHYSTRFKYLEELMGSIIFGWVACCVSLAALVEIRDLFVLNAESSIFLECCCPWLLPALILHGDRTNLKWVTLVCCQPLELLVKRQFVPIFSICMGFYCSKKAGSEKGVTVLQSEILLLAEISENERDILIKKHMVSIVSCILSLASCSSEPTIPYFSGDTLILAVQTVVDGFLEVEESPKNFGVIDNINIFRPDRVFRFILELHHQVATTVHDRHKCCHLAGIEVLVDVLGHRAAVSSTSIYLFNLVGQFINCHALRDQCCRIIFKLLRVFKNSSSKEVITILGEQLQFLVSKLVSCCIPLETLGEHSQNLSQVILLLHQLTVDSHPSLYEFVRELEPFPDISLFDRIRKFHQELCEVYSPRDHFLKFVKRACNLPPRLLLWSLKALHKKLLMGEIIHKEKDEEDIEGYTYYDRDNEIVLAVWNLVRLCGSNDAKSVRALASDFLSRVGIGDPHCVVFHLPGVSNHIHVCQPINLDKDSGVPFELYTSISDELLIALLRILKKHLMDESVTIIDMTSQCLRGILSTERGQKVLMIFDCYERSLLEVHSKGHDINMVQKLLLDLETNFKAKELSLEVSNVWTAEGKTFGNWICLLVYTLIGYCNDTILRLCQDIVSLKSEIAELLLPSVFVNIAGRSDFDVNICELISLKLQEHIFIESNRLMKSIQVLLNAMNELRLCHAMERIVSSSKCVKPLGYNSKSRPSSAKSKDFTIFADKRSISTSLWNKVYWLSIDYLVIAKLAVSCGSYFTSVMYVEYWCKEHFSSLSLGTPDFSHMETMPQHIQILLNVVTKINEPDSLYGIIQSNKLSSQILTFEHEGNWGKALEYYDLQVRSEKMEMINHLSRNMQVQYSQPAARPSLSNSEDKVRHGKSYKGLIRSLQQIGCTHLLDFYCLGLNSLEDNIQNDLEFTELQYEAAWRAGNWDFSSLFMNENSFTNEHFRTDHFNENLHFCLRALQEGSFDEFSTRLEDSKQDLLLSVYNASEESTEYIYSTVVKLQIFDHLGKSWNLRWMKNPCEGIKPFPEMMIPLPEPAIPTKDQLFWLNADWRCILRGTQLHMTLLEPLIAFRKVMLQILGSKDCIAQHLLQAASILRKGSRYSQAAAALHELKLLCDETQGKVSTSYWLGRLEEAKLLHAQGQHEMAINLATHISENYSLNENAPNVFRLVGKWLAENRSSNSRTILEKYLKRAVSVAKDHKTTDSNSISRISQMQFNLAHYADALFRSYEERLSSSEWHFAMRLRKHKTTELEALIKRLKSSTKGDKTDYSIKIQELRKQLAMDKEEAEKLQEDSVNFLSLALEGYKHCLILGDKYDIRVVFRLVSLWFSLSSREVVINNILSTIKEVQSYKFLPLVYQIASRIGASKDGYGPQSFQYSVVSIVKKMCIDHPYHTIFQLLALANGDRIKDKQRSKNSFVIDMDKKNAAENLLNELSSYHGAIIGQMKQMVEIYIKLAELETKREETNKKVLLPRDIRSLRQLELVPVVTSTFPIDRSCQYHQGFFPHFKGLADSVMVMNGVNAPKVVECLGSDGHKYRQLAKSGNDDLRQDAVMEQFFSLVNTFLHNHRDTCKRRLGIRTYKVVPFTPSAGVLEWVSGTLPLGEYLLGSMKNGGAHGRYGNRDWSFLKCREHMTNAKDKCLAFQEVCENFRPVMHHFFLERFLMPAEWFEKRLAYTRSVAASSMVGYIVGLGDRHSMNILIDQASAEVVHIDLGVAFEQGLMLKTPERVPFRLTRDVIDGMGVTGVEGIFRRCCEETLSVMRMNKEALLTIIEVFIHDPLYKWALSPLKALQRQKELDEDLGSFEESEDGYEGNKDAARSLLRVKQKLDGYEEGEMRSVHGQVQKLIQDASDPDHLCQMYPGWGAWL